MRSINQGEKIFCRYPGGTLYTADEIDSLMFEQYLKENHMTLEDYHASRKPFGQSMDIRDIIKKIRGSKN